MAAITIITPHPLKSKFDSLALDDTFSIVQSARNGINTQIFFDFAQAVGMSQKELAALLNISSRTVSNYHEKRKSLEPVSSEHLLKLIALFEKGEEIFGNIAEFNYWLRKPFWNSKERPFDWLNTSGGIDLVLDELTRLAYGDVV